MPDNQIDEEFLIPAFRHTTATIVQSASGVAGAMATDADDFQALLEEFLSRYADYLKEVTADPERSELKLALDAMLQEE